MEIQKDSILLFMKYALPCAQTLVKRGSVSQSEIDNLIEIVKNGEDIPKGAEKIFKVAFAACSLLAKDMKKQEIDDTIIREYFLKGHDTMVDKRYEEMGDFDPDLCKTRIGIVENINDKKAFVNNRTYRTDFVDVHENDKVVTHWDFIVEVIE